MRRPVWHLLTDPFMKEVLLYNVTHHIVETKVEVNFCWAFIILLPSTIERLTMFRYSSSFQFPLFYKRFDEVSLKYKHIHVNCLSTSILESQSSNIWSCVCSHDPGALQFLLARIQYIGKGSYFCRILYDVTKLKLLSKSFLLI